MYTQLKSICTRPELFGAYTAETLWNDPHTSQQMLAYHLMPDIDVSSRSHPFIERSVTWIAKYFGLTPQSHVCDFGCGPGLYTSRYAKICDNVTGIDFSISSIQYAKAQNSRINYVLGNYLDFETDERFDLITMIMCDYCALSPQQRSGLLQKMYALLADGGRILFDVYSLNAYRKREEQAICQHNQLNGFWSKKDYFAYLNTFKYDSNYVVLDKYTVFIEDGSKKEVYNWLQYFSDSDLGSEVAAHGFKVSDIFANVSGDPYRPEGDEFAVVLQRC
ncbi:class I SAM-dependent methyltransferase [Sulfuricurvum sp.]|uniref:class I SAM-dependent methyltransferase n=1 Tax=Sulfuricurvum sp. TaxID=2025608 RepID=UPI00262A7D76|nr:class I SAM-dependent methyltransferase [Sulfuricurvum sp.]MDD3597169.1 class I SAM-dependent methyltransferase [Sulfuricurvum sp.]